MPLRSKSGVLGPQQELERSLSLFISSSTLPNTRLLIDQPSDLIPFYQCIADVSCALRLTTALSWEEVPQTEPGHAPPTQPEYQTQTDNPHSPFSYSVTKHARLPVILSAVAHSQLSPFPRDVSHLVHARLNLHLPLPPPLPLPSRVPHLPSLSLSTKQPWIILFILHTVQPNHLPSPPLCEPGPAPLARAVAVADRGQRAHLAPRLDVAHGRAGGLGLGPAEDVDAAQHGGRGGHAGGLRGGQGGQGEGEGREEREEEQVVEKRGREGAGGWGEELVGRVAAGREDVRGVVGLGVECE